MLIYGINLTNIDPAKAPRATVGSPILYLSLKELRDFETFAIAMDAFVTDVFLKLIFRPHADVL